MSGARSDGRAFVQLTVEGARRTVARLRTRLRAADDEVARLYHGGAAELLDYGTGADGWKALCDDLFADLSWLRPRDPDARLDRVAELRREELSTRAIGDALGVSAATVVNDLRKLEARGEELPDNVVSLNAARRSARGERKAPQPEQPLLLDLEHLQLTPLMREALEHVAGQADGGLSCAELELETGWGHGRASSLLYRLERCGLVARDGFRGPHGVYRARL